MRMWTTTRKTRRGEKEIGRSGAPGFKGLSLILYVAVIASGCGANESILRSRRESPTPVLVEASPNLFEKDLAAMKEADFTWVYVFRRKDGGELDADDKGFVRTNASETNRRVLSDGGKTVIVGSNYWIGDANLKALKDRFDVRDLSLPEQTGPTPTSLKGK